MNLFLTSLNSNQQILSCTWFLSPTIAAPASTATTLLPASLCHLGHRLVLDGIVLRTVMGWIGWIGWTGNGLGENGLSENWSECNLVPVKVGRVKMDRANMGLV